MDDCIFCKIVKGEIPCYKVYENEDFLAFLDISQFTPGHTLVIPKRHFRFIWDVDDIQGYADTVKKICNHFTKDLGFKYVDTLTFGRMVPHAHIHLVPHNSGESGWEEALEGFSKLQSDGSKKLTEEDGKRIQKEISFTD